MKYHKTFLLGAPLWRTDREAFQQAILKRFGGNLHEATDFVTHIADRQISKAGGIISSASFLAGLGYFTHSTAAILVALIAVLCAATSLYTKWPAVEVIEEGMYDYTRTCHICYNRAMVNNAAVFLIVITVFLIAFQLI